MKYRCLTYQEFDLLSSDFNDFLYAEKINKYEWRILQDQHSSAAFRLLEKYSDLIFEKVMKGVQYLEYRTEKQLFLYKCAKDSYTKICIEVPLKSPIVLTDLESLNKLSENELTSYKSYKTISFYKNGREEEIFQLIESGHYIVDQKAFNQVNLFRQAHLN